MLQRKIRGYIRKNFIKINIQSSHNYFKDKDMEISSSSEMKNLNFQKYQKNIPNKHQRNRDICNFEYTNSSYFNITTESHPKNKTIKISNRNDSINSLYSNNQIYKLKNKGIEKNSISLKGDNKSKSSSHKTSFRQEYFSNENYHDIQKNEIAKIHKNNSNINCLYSQIDRYNNEDLCIENDIQNNSKYISINSPFLSINNDKNNSNLANKLGKKLSNLKFRLKDIIFKFPLKKIINDLKKIKLRYYLIDFILIFFQRILKSINQYVFFNLFKKYFNDITLKTHEKTNIFFSILKRLISPNQTSFQFEIALLIKNNIPIYSNKNKNSFFIPYIKPKYEHNLIEYQLFPHSDKKLLNFMQIFLHNEKNKSFDKEIINKYIKRNKLHNRNIFNIIRYIDSFYESLNNNNRFNKNESKSLNKVKFNDQKESKEKFILNNHSVKKSSNSSYFINNNLNIENNYLNFKFLKSKNTDYKNNMTCNFENKIINEIKTVNDNIIKGGEYFNFEQNGYENGFWKDNDFLVSYNNVINKKNECI